MEEHKERRNDIEIKVLSEQIEHLNEKIDRSDIVSETWRQAFCSKVDTVNKKLDDMVIQLASLPCPVRAEVTRAIKSDIGWIQKILYVIIVAVVPSLITLAVAWGALNKEVDYLKNQGYYTTHTYSNSENPIEKKLA